MKAFRGDGRAEMYTSRRWAARLWQPECLCCESTKSKSNTVTSLYLATGASLIARLSRIQESASLRLLSNKDFSRKGVKIKKFKKHLEHCNYPPDQWFISVSECWNKICPREILKCKSIYNKSFKTILNSWFFVGKKIQPWSPPFGSACHTLILIRNRKSNTQPNIGAKTGRSQNGAGQMYPREWFFSF